MTPTASAVRAPLSEAQRSVLQAIDDYQRQHGYAPLQNEVATRLGMSTGRVQQIYQYLRVKGWLRLTPHRQPRGVRLTCTREEIDAAPHEPGVRLDGLTDRQYEMLAAIVAHARRHGRPPTIRHLQVEFGMTSPNGVVCHLLRLEEKGWIERDPMTACGIRILRYPEGMDPLADQPANGEAAALRSLLQRVRLAAPAGFPADPSLLPEIRLALKED